MYEGCLFGIVIFLLLVVVDLEVSELVGIVGGCHNTEPITKVVFLQVLLRQKLQVALGEGHGRREDNLVLLTPDGDLLAHVVCLASDLDPLVKVGLKVGAVHDSIFDRMRTVNGELEGGLLTTNLGQNSFALQGLLSRLGTFLGSPLLEVCLLVSSGFLGGSSGCLNWYFKVGHFNDKIAVAQFVR